jgi:hypothetical protein
MNKSSLQYKRYTREELTEIVTVWSADLPNSRKELIDNYLALQRVVETQQKLIDVVMKARWVKVGKMIQGIFQRGK